MNRREFMQSAVTSLFVYVPDVSWSTDPRIKGNPNTEGRDCNACHDFVYYVEYRLNAVIRDAPHVHMNLEHLADPCIHTWRGDCVYNLPEAPDKEEFLDEWDVDINVSGVTEISVDVELTKGKPTTIPVTVTVAED